MSEINIQEYQDHKFKCNNSFKAINEQLVSLNLAMYGDEKNNVKGILEMVTLMNEFFTSSKLTTRIVRWVILGTFTLSAGIYGLIRLVKEFR